MNNKIVIIISIAAFIFLISGCTHPLKNNEVTNSANQVKVKSYPVNDTEWLKLFEQKATEYIADHEVTDAATFKKQLMNKKCQVNIVEPGVKSVIGEEFYPTFKKGVLMMGKVFKFGDYSENHINVASAFVISKDGVCATNYHVFKSYDPSAPNNYITYFVMDSEQNVYPVKEVLAASKHDDLSIFRIDPEEKELYPLAIGDQKAPGASIHLISHPDHQFFSYTKGYINRHYTKAGTNKIRQSISAEFAHGSSGAPIMDDCGNVVGVVAGTQNVYYGPKDAVYQMTIKEIIPVDRLNVLMN